VLLASRGRSACAHDLVRVDKDDLVEVHGEQDIEEENSVCPDDPLLFTLMPQPRRPFVGDELILETVCLSEVRNEFLCKMVQRLSPSGSGWGSYEEGQ
jgi:hypothetical protein